MAQKEAKSEKLFVGIDLGTSRSAISASSGVNKWVQSFVGWPKDFISAKVLGKDVLFGKDALENRLSLDLYRPLERGVIKEGIERNEEAVKELIRHLISLADPGPNQKIFAIVGVPSDTMKVNKLSIKKAVADFVDSLMVVTEPFAVAYALDLLNNSLVIDIGAGTVDFCIMHASVPSEEDQKTIFTAGDYIDEQFQSYMTEKFPSSKFNRNMLREFKEQYSFVGGAAKGVQVEIPVDGKPVAHDITSELRRACESIVQPIIDTVSVMVARFDPEFQEKIKKNIVLAGGGSQIRGLGDFIQHGLTKAFGSCKVRSVEDPLFDGSKGALKLATEMPDKYWEKIK